MKHNKLLFLLITLVLSLSIIAGCKKEVVEEPDDITSSKDMAFAENLLDMVFKEVDFLATSIGKQDTYYPFTNFGTQDNLNFMDIYYDLDRLCRDGVYRDGHIKVIFKGSYRDSDSIITTSFSFSQDLNYLIGRQTLTNLGRDSIGNLVFKLEEFVTIYRYFRDEPDKEELILYNRISIRTWIAGEYTLSWLDDKYSINSISAGINSKGKHFTTNTTKPITVDLSCQWRKVSGKVELIEQDKPTQIIDYGDNSCDPTATVNIKDKMYKFDVKW